MKKSIISILSVILLSLIVISCSKDDEDNSYAKITVKKSGELKSGVAVYMFTDDYDPTSSSFKPLFAYKTAVTESDGVATFNLQDVFDLRGSDSELKLYFGVFDADAVLDYTAISINKGETKTATISY